ncbi:hypothetical protein GCM10027321_14580 [Massilia terrae]|uniref:Uncharacterized protein n=1 Tax=Massilia terrae TaxID=1811224 RepID=A0ABT2CX66_9BURK|nr:hypothetical protein [Massilia terrae]MCS0657698.1 hypothetical protein [Massilia terrae]
MFTMILMVYLQQNLDVTLQQAAPHGRYQSRGACEQAAVRLRGPVPIPKTYSAAWQDALCVPIKPNVQVNPAPLPDLARVLREQPGSGCQAEGAWRRLAETCVAPR